MSSAEGKGKGWALVIAPQVDTATAEALRYMGRTKQRRIYLPYTFPAEAGTHLPIARGWRVWVSPGPGRKEQLAHGCYATARSLVDSNQWPRGRWSSALTTRLSRHPTTRPRQKLSLTLVFVGDEHDFNTARKQTLVEHRPVKQLTEILFPQTFLFLNTQNIT